MSIGFQKYGLLKRHKILFINPNHQLKQIGPQVCQDILKGARSIKNIFKALVSFVNDLVVPRLDANLKDAKRGSMLDVA